MEKETEQFEAIIYIKVGTHAGESIDEIISRKQNEEKRAGMFFWGYSGKILFPSTQVLPFIEESKSRGIVPKLLMHVIQNRSRNRYNPHVSQKAEYYSKNKEDDWQLIPQGISVIGSDYALVCRNLKKVNTTIDLSLYELANSKRRGDSLDNYIRNQIDKACAFLKTPFPRDYKKSDTIVEISYVADLVEPYAVFLK